MRIILLITLLASSSITCAAEWIQLGETPEARVMLDANRVEMLDGGITAWLKFNYRREQPGQNVTNGKPFDSSVNLYYVVCSSRKFQVLQLFMFHKEQSVGTFEQRLNPANLDEPKLGSAAVFLMDKVCPSDAPSAPTRKN